MRSSSEGRLRRDRSDWGRPVMTTKAPDIAARVYARSPNRRLPHVMCHRWESLLFLHWRVPAAQIQEMLPAGLTVDTYDGDAYVGIVPFLMRNVRPVGLPAIPWLSNFHELNVRTYVYDSDGVPGVWFHSLSCDQRLAVFAARAFAGLNYVSATMSSTSGAEIDYSCRRADSAVDARYRYRPTGAPRVAEPGSLEFFLVERYYLLAMRRGSLIRGQVAHQPYPIRAAEVPQWSVHPAHLDGFNDIAGEPAHICYADGVDVNVYAAEKIG